MKTTKASRRGSATVTFPSDREIRLTRIFDAPARLVFDAWTKTEHVPRWFGAGHGALVVCEIDLRVGGTWRFVQRAADGTEHGFHGEYREIDAPHRLVSTWIYEPSPEAEALETITLVEQDGRTTLTSTAIHKSREHRDAHLNAGMEQGMQASLDALERVLASML
jgi:uncharacterized protein YndB with AHSA1/START domain